MSSVSGGVDGLVTFLENIASFMRVDLVARYHAPVEEGRRGTYAPHRSPLTRRDLELHLDGEQPLGLYVLSEEDGRAGRTRCAIVDIDDKTKKLTWVDLCAYAARVDARLRARGFLAWPCRSGSGHGIHLWLFWEPPVSAVVLRRILLEVAREEEGPHIDIFPAQDHVPEGGLGNLVALPLSRQSRPILNLATGAIAADLEEWLPVSPSLSASPQEIDLAELEAAAGQGLGRAEEDRGSYGPVDLQELEAALERVPNDEYTQWMRVGIALKNAAAGGQLTEAAAEEAWTRWASRSDKFNERAQRYNWNKFKPDGRLSLGTVWHLAAENGWRASPVVIPRQTIEEVAAKVHQQLAEIEIPAEHVVNYETHPWLTGQGPDYVKGLNKDHFIALEGGRATIFKEDWDAALRRHRLTRMLPTDFKMINRHRRVKVGENKKGDDITRDLGTAWLDDPYRRQYENIVLEPAGCEPWFYNLWRGWSVEPSQEGSCEIFKNHVLENLCGGDVAVYEYVIDWCAVTVQRPQEPIGTAIVLRGEQGVGKGTFPRVLGSLFGQHYLHLTSSRDLTGRFNSHLQDCILLFADEAVWAGSKAEAGTLRGIITEPYLSIESKGRDLYQCRNMLHMIIATNNEWSIPAGLDERRFLALKVGSGKKQDKKYFKSLWDELNAGGRAKLLHELLNRDVSRFDMGAVPRTQELLDQKMLSMDPVSSWWMERLREGSPMEEQNFSWDDEEVSSQALYLDYIGYCRRSGIHQPGFIQHLTFKLEKGLLPPRYEKSLGRSKVDLLFQEGTVKRGQRCRYLKLPALADCRRTMETRLQQNIDWGADLIDLDGAASMKKMDDEPLL